MDKDKHICPTRNLTATTTIPLPTSPTTCKFRIYSPSPSKHTDRSIENYHEHISTKSTKSILSDTYRTEKYFSYPFLLCAHHYFSLTNSRPHQIHHLYHIPHLPPFITYPKPISVTPTTE